MSNADLSEPKLHESVRLLIQSGQEGAKWERRQHVRYPVIREVSINLGNDDLNVPALTLEISRIGVGLLHRKPIRIGDSTPMTIQYRCGFSMTIPMLCKWCRPCGKHWYISGLCFQDMSTDLGESHSWNPESTFAHTKILELLGLNMKGMAERRELDPNLDKRCEERYQVSLPVSATPIDEQMQPVGDRFDAVTHDISSRGLALFVDNELDRRCKYLILQVMDFAGQTQLDATMEVMRTRPTGHLFTVGGQFVISKYIDHR